VTLTRLSDVELDDVNLQDSLSAVRAYVAKREGLDDRDARIMWVYDQQKCREGYFAVRICIKDGELNEPKSYLLSEESQQVAGWPLAAEREASGEI
jgi:hypothetical protein